MKIRLLLKSVRDIEQKKLCAMLAGGVRHDPQRYMGKIVAVPHFNPDTVEFASPREITQTQ